METRITSTHAVPEMLLRFPTVSIALPMDLRLLLQAVTDIKIKEEILVAAGSIVQALGQTAVMTAGPALNMSPALVRKVLLWRLGIAVNTRAVPITSTHAAQEEMRMTTMARSVETSKEVEA